MLVARVQSSLVDFCGIYSLGSGCLSSGADALYDYIVILTLTKIVLINCFDIFV